MFFCVVWVLASFIEYAVCMDQLREYYCINPTAPNCQSNSSTMSPDTPKENRLESACWYLLDPIHYPLHTICRIDLRSQAEPYRRHRIWIVCRSTYTSGKTLKNMKFLGIIKLTLILSISSVKLKVSELINPPLQEFSQMPHFLA